jgi:hypothetical protein
VPRQNPRRPLAFEEIAPRARAVREGMLTVDGDMTQCFYDTAGEPFRVAWYRCNSPKALLSLCVNAGVEPRLVAAAVQKCAMLAWSKLSDAYGPGSVRFLIERLDRYLDLAIDDRLDANWNETGNITGREIAGPDESVRDVIEERFSRGQPEMEDYLPDRATQARVAGPVRVLKILYWTLFHLVNAMDGGDGRDRFTLLPGQAQVFLDDAVGRSWKSFRKECAVAIRSVIPWWVVAVHLRRVGEDLGEPLWFSVVEEFLPGTATAAERAERNFVAQQVANHRAEIEDYARSMVAQNAWMREREAARRGEPARFEALRMFVDPYMERS